MDKQIQDLNLGTKLFVDNSEYEIKWNKAAKQDDILQVGQYILNDILKKYQTDSFIMKVNFLNCLYHFKNNIIIVQYQDHEHQEYGLKDIISFQVKEIFVFLNHKKEVKTYIKTDMRDFRQVYYFINPEQVKIERFKEKTVKIDSLVTNLQIIKKQNQGFESTLRQLVEQRLNNLQINNPSSPKIFFVPPTNNNKEDEQEDEAQLSPKFGASSDSNTTTTTKQNTSAFQSSPQNQQKLLGGQNDVSFDEGDLKTRQKVAGLGTQQDYMKKQAQVKPQEIKGYTMQDVAQHNTDKDAWVVINGKIYDVTHYLNYHPGGKGKLMMGVGRDGTDLFQKYHPWVNAHYILAKNHIGYIVLK